MKLEVGQKIGIYQVISNGGFDSLIISKQYLGLNTKSFFVNILDEDNDFIPMFPEEIKKVGSLIVKSIK